MNILIKLYFLIDYGRQQKFYVCWYHISDLLFLELNYCQTDQTHLNGQLILLILIDLNYSNLKFLYTENY